VSGDGLLDVAGFPPESFDRILLDPPCSALGLRPKLGIRVVANELVKTADYQRVFLQQAIQLLKPGGILTYSTCTINAMENECNVAYVLDRYADCMSLLQLPTKCHGHEGLAGHGLTEEQRLCVRRFDTADRKDNCMGFFIAKFQKKVV
jgi:methyltransferase NSUN6